MRTWKNHSGDQECHPRDFRRPRTLEELADVVGEAERLGTTARMIGTGHSWSDVTFTDGLMVLPDGIAGLLEYDDGTLRDSERHARRVRVLGGTRLRELNAALNGRGLALANMGGYDGQRLAGVVSTSTHGSGLNWGPFPDIVRSLDLVIARGERVRVEPAGGITDPARYDGRLIQDDGTFQAAVVGMGCMGFIGALVIDVRETFWLNEVRTLDTWEKVKPRLNALLAEGDHYELFLNPYSGKVLVTRRTDCPEPVGVPQDKLERHPLTELEASLPITGVLLKLAARWLPSIYRKRFDGVLQDMVDDGYANLSYKVFNIGAANKLPAYSMELGIPLSGDRHLAAVDRILAMARESKILHTSPVSLRFVGASPAFASMMYEEPTMMIELIMVLGSRKGRELLAGYETAFQDLGVRSHWGQYNLLTPERVRAAYPRWDDWLAVYREFNASGVFNSPFTDRIGISVR